MTDYIIINSIVITRIRIFFLFHGVAKLKDQMDLNSLNTGFNAATVSDITLSRVASKTGKNPDGSSTFVKYNTGNNVKKTNIIYHRQFRGFM